MAFDLQKMLHRKGEFGIARPDAFAVRVGARKKRGLAAALDLPANDLVKAIAAEDDDAIVDRLAVEHGRDRVTAAEARAQAKIDTRAELGDPTPVRLA